MPLGTSLPYGLRDVKIVQYPDLQATAFGTLLVDLPNAQTFSFSETEEYTELRGDDKLVTSHGNGAQADCNLESGGISIDAYKAINGGTVVETGLAPNQRKRYRKISTDQRPFITVIGQSISDSGGDMHGIVYLARATGDIQADRQDGEFMIPSVDFTGYPCRVVGTLGGMPILDALYDFDQHEAITAIVAPALDTPSVPTLSSIDDITGPAAGGELVRIYGLGFNGTTGVTVGGTAVTDFSVVSNTEMWIVTPAHAAGATVIIVTNATGASSATPVPGANQYTYV